MHHRRPVPLELAHNQEGQPTHQFPQFVAAVGSWVERRAILENQAADAAERCETVIARRRHDRLDDDFLRFVVKRHRRTGLDGFRLFGCGLRRSDWPQVLCVDEFVAGGDKGSRSLLFAEPVHRQTGFPDARRQPGEIAVGGDQAKAIDPARVEQIHRVDNQRRVGGILSRGVAELLDRLNRHRVQRLLPAFEIGRGPVAVSPFDRRSPKRRYFSEQFLDDRSLGIISVNQDREFRVIRHQYQTFCISD